MLLASDLSELAINLNQQGSNSNRFSNMLNILRKLVNSDAASLLVFRGQKFIPLATSGLAQDVVGRRFDIHQHPRLQIIARAGDIVRFSSDSDLPDPFDGLIPNHDGKINVHACIGLPLLVNQQLIGALTLDSFDSKAFDDFSNETLRTIASITAGALYSALLIDRLETKTSRLVEQDRSPENMMTSDTEIIGESAETQELKNTIMAVADCDLNVLILGETGVGKELVAKAIHNYSSRKNKPLIYLNCAALPESVAESELFGHIKGAFTGAINHRQGKFELANKGTLFLDEIGELPLSLQAKLLRVIQYGDLQRVGDDQILKVDVRIIAATNKNLSEEVKQHRFRADLYHRLSVFPIVVQPLRERGNDVILLAGYFIEKTRIKFGLQHIQLSSFAADFIMNQAWLGNVRELENAIYRAVVLAKAENNNNNNLITIETRHFNQMEQIKTEIKADTNSQSSFYSSAYASKSWSGEPLREATDNFQKHLLTEVLKHNQNNWSATARDLGMNSGNLHRLAKRLHMK